MACHFIDAIYDVLWSLDWNSRIWGKFVATCVILSNGKLGELMLNLCFFSSLFSHCSVYAMIPVHNMHPPPKLLSSPHWLVNKKQKRRSSVEKCTYSGPLEIVSVAAATVVI